MWAKHLSKNYQEWEQSWPTFTHSWRQFVAQGAEDYVRRGALFQTAMNRDVVSFYEAFHLLEDEAIAMAAAAEDWAIRQETQGVTEANGRTADGASVLLECPIFIVPNLLQRPLTKAYIHRKSERDYLVEVRLESTSSVGATMPASMIFCSEEIAAFMQQELLAYSSTPDVRRVMQSE